MEYRNNFKSITIIALAATSSVVAFSQGALNTQSVYNAYWSTAGGFQSLAQLHNNSMKQTLTIQPTLFAPNGQSLRLDLVALAPLGNSTIDIGAQLTAKGWNQSTNGSAVFQYQAKTPGALGVEVYEGNAPKSLSFTIPSKTLLISRSTSRLPRR